MTSCPQIQNKPQTQKLLLAQATNQIFWKLNPLVIHFQFILQM